MAKRKFDAFTKFMRSRRAEKRAAEAVAQNSSDEVEHDSDGSAVYLFLQFIRLFIRSPFVVIPICFVSVLFVVSVAVAPLAWVGLILGAISLYAWYRKYRQRRDDGSVNPSRLLQGALLIGVLSGLALMIFDLNRNGSELALKSRVLVQKFSSGPANTTDTFEQRKLQNKAITDLWDDLIKELEKYSSSPRVADDYPNFLTNAEHLVDRAKNVAGNESGRMILSSAEMHYDTVKRDASFYKASHKDNPAYQRAFPELMQPEKK